MHQYPDPEPERRKTPLPPLPEGGRCGLSGTVYTQTHRRQDPDEDPKPVRRDCGSRLAEAPKKGADPFELRGGATGTDPSNTLSPTTNPNTQ